MQRNKIPSQDIHMNVQVAHWDHRIMFLHLSFRSTSKIIVFEKSLLLLQVQVQKET